MLEAIAAAIVILLTAPLWLGLLVRFAAVAVPLTLAAGLAIVIAATVLTP